MLGDEIVIVTNSRLSMYIPTIIPHPDTQRTCNEALTKRFK